MSASRTCGPRGPPVQRPLWASTGVKNPAYPDTMYVEGLVGPETVDTMPMATLLAAGDHARVDPEHPTVAIDPDADLRARPTRGSTSTTSPRSC